MADGCGVASSGEESRSGELLRRGDEAVKGEGWSAWFGERRKEEELMRRGEW